MKIDLRNTDAKRRPGETLVDPITGELVSLNDPDELIDAFERVTVQDRKLYAFKCDVIRALSKLCPGESKTEYVRGKNRVCKVTQPSARWDQGKLKEAWNSYPKLRDELLRINSLAVNLREFKKAMKSSGPRDWEQLRGMINGAELPATGNPRVEPQPKLMGDS